MADNSNRTHAQNNRQAGKAKAGIGKTFLISNRQSSAIIASTLIGVGVLTLPRESANAAGESAWLAALGGGLISMVGMAIIVKLSNRYPGQSIVEYAASVFGPANRPLIGRLLSFPIFLALFLFWGTSTALVARTFGEVVITTVLTKTPLEVIISSMLITAFVFVMYDEEVLARVNEILLPIIVIPVLVIALSSLQSARLDNFLPVFDGNWGGLLKSMYTTSTSYLGFEMMAIFFAKAELSDKRMSGSLVGIAIPSFIYVLIVVSGISVFGVEEMQLLAWPTLELVKTTEVPGLILERLESAFLGVWVAAVFTSVGNMYFATAIVARQAFKLRTHRWIAVCLLPIIYWLSLIPPNIQKLFEFQKWSGQIGIILAFVVPALLLLISLLRKQRGNSGGSRKEANRPHE
ncbi:GerAB/ArcD/ProY family transporter [Paenibacillus sp. GYB003]|uniref:GerAB/ArcD/ProY family transporter n=1 Tax=Paenibacillus sp. GYB003 TaxID=2994392 RepID=UPI002F96E20E